MSDDTTPTRWDLNITPTVWDLYALEALRATLPTMNWGDACSVAASVANTMVAMPGNRHPAAPTVDTDPAPVASLVVQPEPSFRMVVGERYIMSNREVGECVSIDTPATGFCARVKMLGRHSTATHRTYDMNGRWSKRPNAMWDVVGPFRVRVGGTYETVGHAVLECMGTSNAFKDSTVYVMRNVKTGENFGVGYRESGAPIFGGENENVSKEILVVNPLRGADDD